MKVNEQNRTEQNIYNRDLQMAPNESTKAFQLHNFLNIFQALHLSSVRAKV